MATMQDVATVARVSLSTVSYAMNNTRPISPPPTSASKRQWGKWTSGPMRSSAGWPAGAAGSSH